MAAMFLAMVWHARRRLHAMEDSERVSMANLRLLEREHRFVQDASHELRTPITVALGHAELIQRRAEDDTTAEDAAIIADELLRLRRLADRLLVLAGSEDPGFLHRVDVELEDIASDAVRRWTATPRRWLLRSDGEAHVLADPERLAVALDALIENAVNHTAEGDTIELGGRVAPPPPPSCRSTTPGRGSRPTTSSGSSTVSLGPTPDGAADRAGSGSGSRSSARSWRHTVDVSTCEAARGAGTTFEIELPVAPTRTVHGAPTPGRTSPSPPPPRPTRRELGDRPARPRRACSRPGPPTCGRKDAPERHAGLVGRPRRDAGGSSPGSP